MKRCSASLLVLVFLASGCDTLSDPTTSTSAVPTTNAGEDTPFTLVVEPGEFAPVSAGQHCVVLVSIEGGTEPAITTASVTGAATVDPPQHEVDPGEVVEFTVIPQPSLIGDRAPVETIAPEPVAGDGTIALELIARRGGRQESATLSMEMVEWVDDLEPLASELRDRFVTYLETHRPELGITSETIWTPTITKPQILVVMHYLFFSEEWEMGIVWHVTVPEHAWSRMYLRARDELHPSIGLEIPSWPDPTSEPIPWDPPTEVDR